MSVAWPMAGRGRPARDRGGFAPAAVPRLGRMVAVPAVLAHAFALAGLLPGWHGYREPLAAAVLFLVSAALPAVLVIAPRRNGGRLPGWAAATVVAGVFVVSAAVPALLPPHLRSSWQSWNWGTGAMTLLGLAAYVPTMRILALAGAHAAVAVVVQLLSGGGWWRADLVLVSTLVPPLGAAQFLHLSADAVRRRARAVADRSAADTGRRELDVARVDGDRRLAELRGEIELLLQRIAAGSPLPLDDVAARQARQLAERLRGALVAQRQALWLPDRLGAAPVTVVCPDAVGRGLGTAERAWLAALLDLLGRHPGWRSVRVVLQPCGERPAGRRWGSRPTATVTVTAEGPAAAQAGTDPSIRALGGARGARMEIEGAFLSIEGDLRLTSGA